MGRKTKPSVRRASSICFTSDGGGLYAAYDSAPFRSSSGEQIVGKKLGCIFYNPAEFRPLFYNQRYLIGSDGTVLDLERERIVNPTINGYSHTRKGDGVTVNYHNYRVCIVPPGISKGCKQWGHFQRNVPHLIIEAWQDKFNPEWHNLLWSDISGGPHLIPKGVPAEQCGMGLRIDYVDGDTSNFALSNLRLVRKTVAKKFAVNAATPSHKYVISKKGKRGPKHGSVQQMVEAGYPQRYIDEILKQREKNKEYALERKKKLDAYDTSIVPMIEETMSLAAMVKQATEKNEVIVVPEHGLFFTPEEFTTQYKAGRYHYDNDKFAVMPREDAVAFSYKEV